MGKLQRSPNSKERSSETMRLLDPSARFLLAVDLVITAVLLSVAGQIWLHRHNPGWWPAFFSRATFGFGDPFYFVTSGFLWLQGLYYVRSVLTRCTLPVFTASVQPVIACYGSTLITFVLIQYFFRIPEGWAGAGFQSPFEDISSFGSISVAVSIFAAATLRRDSTPWMPLRIIYVFVLFTLVAVSWSRAAWLAALVFLLILAWVRLPRRWVSVIMSSTLIVVLLISHYADSPPFQEHTYLARVAALFRIENLAHKDPSRMDLYYKAAGMIWERPWSGHGVGSFYLNSTHYAQLGSPYALTPNFAHNSFLQVAAEMGLPVAILWLAIISGLLWDAWRDWRKLADYRSGSPFEGRMKKKILAATMTPQTVCHASPDQFVLLGIMLAMGAYLQTQMTANSLNVYASHQFFFGFLLVALLALTSKQTYGSKINRFD
jgi:O-antigen ligase